MKHNANEKYKQREYDPLFIRSHGIFCLPTMLKVLEMPIYLLIPSVELSVLRILIILVR